MLNLNYMVMKNVAENLENLTYEHILCSFLKLLQKTIDLKINSAINLNKSIRILKEI